MDQLCLSNISMKGRLPLLSIKINSPPPQLNLLKHIPAYLSNDIVTNLQQCNNTLTTLNGGKLSNLWTSPKRREKYKHISDNPICICGAGNDLTFLYDNVAQSLDELKQDSITGNEKIRKKQRKPEDKTIVKIPEKIFPVELTLSTHHGIQSTQLYDEKFSTKPLSHICHKTTLPVMNPNIVSNSNKTYQSLQDIFERGGLNDNIDYQMPTPLHKLLIFVKKEQDLYNIIFHEVIKEATVDCIERGELLSNLRQRYRNIFVKVPEKIKDFHDKIVAKRILDRRLTEELMRFQNTVSKLSSELSGVKDHEDKTNQIFQRAKNQLKEVVEKTKTNADLLREYHELYEQQRRRLEKTVVQLEAERDCWRKAAYRITDLVLSRYDMKSGIILVDSEYNAIELSHHFVELLTATDNEALSIVKDKANEWCNEAQKFSLMLAIREENLKVFLEKTINRISQFKNDFEEDYLSDQNQMLQPLDKDETIKTLTLFSELEKSISEVCELFGGQSMLVEEDKLRCMKQICSDYTDAAIEVFNRHRNETDDSLYPEHVVLYEINKMINRMMVQFMDQLTGDNGVADGIMALQTYLENWINRLSSCVSEQFFHHLPDSEWIRLHLILDDWVGLLHESRASIGAIKLHNNSGDELSKKRLEVHEIIQSVDNWSHKSASGIESENLKLSEAIINLKINMVRWISLIILRLAPDFPTNSTEAKRAARIASVDLKELEESSNVLHSNLKKFTNYITNCSKDSVARLARNRNATQSESPDSHNLKLQQLLEYSKSWMEKSEEILKETMKLEYEPQMMIDIMNNSILRSDMIEEQEEKESDSENDLDVGNLVGQIIDKDCINKDINEDMKKTENSEEVPLVEGVGADFNVHSRVLVQDPDKPYSGNQFDNIEKIDLPSDLPQTVEAFQLIQIFELLQNNLRSLNLEALVTENELISEELEVARSESYFESLQQTFNKLNKDIENMKTENSQTLPIPALFSATNTIETGLSEPTNRSHSGKSASSNKRRAPRQVKKNIKK